MVTNVFRACVLVFAAWAALGSSGPRPRAEGPRPKCKPVEEYPLYQPFVEKIREGTEEDYFRAALQTMNVAGLDVADKDANARTISTKPIEGTPIEYRCGEDVGRYLRAYRMRITVSRGMLHIGLVCMEQATLRGVSMEWESCPGSFLVRQDTLDFVQTIAKAIRVAVGPEEQH